MTTAKDDGQQRREECEVCGAADPRWLRWVDQDVGDFFARTMRAMPGPNAKAVRYCERETCAIEVEARYGPTGNRASLSRLTDELGQKGLDADANEVRLMALCADLLSSGRIR